MRALPHLTLQGSPDGPCTAADGHCVGSHSAVHSWYEATVLSPFQVRGLSTGRRAVWAPGTAPAFSAPQPLQPLQTHPTLQCRHAVWLYSAMSRGLSLNGGHHMGHHLLRSWGIFLLDFHITGNSVPLARSNHRRDMSITS